MFFMNFSFGSSSSTPINTITTGLIVAVVAGVILFLLNWGREWLTSHLKRKSEAEVLAFSLVTQLDKLIADCAEVVEDNGEMDRQTGIWDTTVRVPFIEYPDWDWWVLPRKLQYQIRSLPNRIYLANRSVGSLWEYGEGPPEFSDAFEERQFRWSWIGLEACLINDILAERYGVPLLDRGDWKPADRFKERIAEITEAREHAEAHPWPTPSWLVDETPDEELKERMSKLSVDLDAAVKRHAAT